MNIVPLPPKQYLVECFQYTEEGCLIWKRRPTWHFKTQRGHAIFLRGDAGKVAGTWRDDYLKIILSHNGKRLNLQASRIIWAIHNGDIPDGYLVDHEDTDTTNNRIGNLRLALPTQNAHNGKLRTNNASGIKGVSWCERDQRWVTRVTKNYRQFSVGSFKLKEDAEEAVRTARSALHGKFTNHGIANDTRTSC